MKELKLSDEEFGYLESILEDYISTFAKKKKHKEAHNKEPCYYCENAKKILKKIKRKIDDDFKNNSKIKDWPNPNWNFLNKIKSKEMREIIKEGIVDPSLIGLDYADLNAILKGTRRIRIVKGNSIRAVAKKSKKIKGSNKVNGVLIYIIGAPDVRLQEFDDTGKLVTENLNPEANVILGAQIKNLKQGTRKVYAVLAWKKARRRK